mgnify:CR=1 FL=1
MKKPTPLIILTLFWACSNPEPVSFNKDIAPILHKECVGCHRAEGGAPFPLITYDQARRKAKMIGEVTGSGYMPPWPADPEYSSFIGEMTLSESEIQLIQEWIDQGAVEGKEHPFPTPPKFPDGSLLGKPDLVLEMPDSIPLPGTNTDEFLAVKIPFEVPKDTFIRAIEFVPGNRDLVHHVNGHMIAFNPEKKQNVEEGRFWVDPEAIHGMSSPEIADSVNRALGLLHDDGSYPTLIPSVTNYLPGVLPTVYPEGIGGYILPQKGAFYLRNLHYGPSPVPSSDRSKIHVFYAENPPKRKILETQLGTLGVSPIEPEFVIPPESIMTFTSNLYCPVPISILTVNPHMHLLGTKFLAYATAPGKDTIPLIKIDDWDFRWQYFYTYPKMKKIPAGYTIHCYGTFDNTSENPHNPYNPPRTVRPPSSTTNMKTTDEMFQFIITYLPYQNGDENQRLDAEGYFTE